MADTLVNAEDYVAEFKGSGLLFEQALAQADMAVCITDPRLPDNPIVFVNEAFLQLTGYRLKEVLGRNCRFLQGEGTNLEHIQRLRKAIREGSSILVELRNYRKDGTAFWNALHVGPIFDEAGELIYYFGSQMDVTDVHDAREATPDTSLVSGRILSFLNNLSSVFAPKSAKRDAEHANLSEVVEHILQSYQRGKSGGYSVAGPHMALAEENIGAVGLCLHELASRAAKDGVWAEETGNVAIRWDTPENDCLTVRWIEDWGRDADLGSRISAVLSTIVDSLNGSFDLDVGASRREVVLRIPLKDGASC